VGLDRNLKLKIQQSNSEVARIEVDRQRAGHYPSLDVVGRYYRQDTGGSLFGGGSIVDTQDVMLELNVPIFEGGMIRSKTREAQERSSAAVENVERQRRTVVRQVHSAYDGIKTAKSRAEALEKSIEAQSYVLEAKQQGYRSGIYTSLAVLDASRDLYLLRRDYAQSRFDYVFNTMRLKQAMGTLGDDDLVIVNNWLQ
jgi:outer membrane protein